MTQAAQVKALSEGRMQFPSGAALKSPYWQQMLTAVSEYDPNFDAVNYNSRSKTRNDFTSGKSAQNITSLNTAIHHLGSLNDDSAGLNNSNVGDWWNSAANAMEKRTGNTGMQTAMTNVGMDANAAAGELAKVFRSSGMSDKDIDSWKESLNTSNTPAEFNASVKKGLDLMDGRLESLGQQYNQGMGTTKDPVQLLSPDAQRIYTNLKNGKPASAGQNLNHSVSVSTPTQVPSSPQVGTISKGYRFKGGNPANSASWEAVQ